MRIDTTATGQESGSGPRRCSDRSHPDLPSLTILDRPAASQVRKSARTRWRAATLVAVHILVAAHITHYAVSGRTLSPVEPSESMDTLEYGYLNAGGVFFAMALLASLVFGRFFCGWGCHIVALQDLCGALLRRAGIRPKPFRSRLLRWAPAVVAGYMFVWRPVRAAWFASPAARGPGFTNHLLTTQFWSTFPGPLVAVVTFLVCGFAAVYFLGAKGFCTYACPYGALFGVADRFAPGRIVVSDACDGCGHCTATCTSNVRVHEEVRLHGKVVDPGCMKCLDCVSVCPTQALSFGFATPAPLARVAGRRYDFTWAEEVALALVCLAATLAFRGLYDVVPLLLAVALGALTAFLTMTLCRLVLRPDVRLQNLQLRSGGRVTRTAGVFAAATVLWLAVVVHGGFVQWHRACGRWALDQASLSVTDLLEGTRRTDGRRSLARHEAAAARAYASLLTADKWGLLGVVEVKLGLAALEIRRRDPRAAESRLREALALQPDTARLYLNLYVFLMQQNRFAEARDVLEAKLACTPPSADDHFRLAALLVVTKRPDQAINHYRACVELAPGWARAHHNLGGLLWRLGRTEQAVGELRIAHRLAPDDPATNVELGLALRAAGEPCEALRALRRAAEREPQRVEPYADAVHALEEACSSGAK